jgi:hypothetical protein
LAQSAQANAPFSSKKVETMMQKTSLALGLALVLFGCGAPSREDKPKKSGGYSGTVNGSAGQPGQGPVKSVGSGGYQGTNKAPGEEKPHDHSASGAGRFSVTGDHAHGDAPHGGVVATSGDKHVELVPHGADHLAIYLFDDAMKLLPVEGVSGKIRLSVGGAVSEVPLAADGDHLGAVVAELSKLTPASGKAVVLLDLTIGGKPHSARYEYDPAVPAAPAAKGDAVAHMHDSRHGGQVGMSGETHIEVALSAPGEFRVYLSDSHRAPLPASQAKEAKILINPDDAKPLSLPMAPDAKDEYLIAKGTPQTGEAVPVKVEFSLAGAPVSMEFQLQNKK